MICCSQNKWKWVAIAVLAGLGSYYLWVQHKANVFQYWPFAFFLLCPLMHFFGHGAHDANHIKSESKKSDK